jgi:manganese efflux pump family protein
MELAVARSMAIFGRRRSHTMSLARESRSPYASPVLGLLLVAGSLGLDNFAASIAIGLSGVDQTLRVRIALAFGLFEALMPAIGLLFGRQLSGTLGDWAHVIGGLLLITVGIRTVVAGVRSGEGGTIGPADAGLGRILALAVGLSIDNLIVGFALGAYRAPLALSIAIIAGVSVGLSLVGLELGAKLGTRVEHRSELLSGVVLISVGAAILTNLL